MPSPLAMCVELVNSRKRVPKMSFSFASLYLLMHTFFFLLFFFPNLETSSSVSPLFLPFIYGSCFPSFLPRLFQTLTFRFRLPCKVVSFVASVFFFFFCVCVLSPLFFVFSFFSVLFTANRTDCALFDKQLISDFEKKKRKCRACLLLSLVPLVSFLMTFTVFFFIPCHTCANFLKMPFLFYLLVAFLPALRQTKYRLLRLFFFLL